MTTAKETSKKRNAKVVSKPKNDMEAQFKEMEKKLAEERAKNEKLLAEKNAREEQERLEEMDRYVSDSIKETNQVVTERIRNTYAKHSKEQKLCLAIAEQIISFKPEEIKKEFGGSDRMGIGRAQGMAINKDPFVQESLAAHGYDLEAMIKKHGKAKEINQ